MDASDLDLTNAVEDAAYALFTQTINASQKANDEFPLDDDEIFVLWMSRDPMEQFPFKEAVVPIVNAAAQFIAAQGYEVGYTDGYLATDSDPFSNPFLPWESGE